MYALVILLPIFLVVASGWGLRRSGFLPLSFFRAANKLVFWVGLPGFLVVKVSEAKLAGPLMLRVVGVLSIGVLLAVAIGLVMARMLHLKPRQRGAFVQAAFRGNLAYVGIPVCLYALGGLYGEAHVESLAVIVLAPMVILYNVLSVVLLHQGGGTGSLWRSLFTNPLILSCLTGALLLAFGVELPEPLRRTGVTLGQMALPLSLLALGASIELRLLRGRILPVLGASLIKTVLGPLLGWGLAVAMGLSGAALGVTLIYLACPTAVATYVMADQLGADEHLAGACVVFSTLASGVVLTLVVSAL